MGENPPIPVLCRHVLRERFCLRPNRKFWALHDDHHRAGPVLNTTIIFAQGGNKNAVLATTNNVRKLSLVGE